jgi:hypothetical protein
LDNGFGALKVRDRHMTVDENSEAEILEWIDAQTEKYSPVTPTDLRHYYEVKYSISIN